MAFDAHVLNVLIASPGDTLEVRNIIERALHQWNSDRARSAQVVLLPRRWETDSVPFLGADAQAVINEQLVADADILFGVFHSRLGTQTPRDESGAAEEIRRHADAGKPTHVYIADMPHPADVDTTELARLQSFRKTMQEKGLLGTFVSPEDLSTKVRSAIEADLERLSLGDVSVPSANAGGVLLRARYDSYQEPYTDSAGKLKHRTRGTKIIVKNEGAIDARTVKLEVLTASGEDAGITVWADDMDVDLRPGDEMSYPIAIHMGIGSAVKVRMTWESDQGPGETMQVVPL